MHWDGGGSWVAAEDGLQSDASVAVGMKGLVAAYAVRFLL